MCDDIPNFALFELHPMSAKGMNILRHNQELGLFPRGFDHFIVTAKHVSRTGRGLVAVGREVDNDIQYKQGNRYSFFTCSRAQGWWCLRKKKRCSKRMLTMTNLPLYSADIYAPFLSRAAATSSSSTAPASTTYQWPASRPRAPRTRSGRSGASSKSTA